MKPRPLCQLAVEKAGLVAKVLAGAIGLSLIVLGLPPANPVQAQEDGAPDIIFFTGPGAGPGAVIPSEERAPLSTLARTVVASLAKASGLRLSAVVAPQSRALEFIGSNENACMAAVPNTINGSIEGKYLPVKMIIERAAYTTKPLAAQLHSLADLRGHRIGAVGGGPLEQLIEANGGEFNRVNDDNLNVDKLSSGRIDAWITARGSDHYEATLANKGIVLAFDIEPVMIMFLCNARMSTDKFNRLSAAQGEALQSNAPELEKLRYRIER
jgi:ABC-type nitrate/sulfonate/bicarbonate transport system substrate-binding protein